MHSQQEFCRVDQKPKGQYWRQASIPEQYISKRGKGPGLSCTLRVLPSSRPSLCHPLPPRKVRTYQLLQLVPFPPLHQPALAIALAIALACENWLLLHFPVPHGNLPLAKSVSGCRVKKNQSQARPFPRRLWTKQPQPASRDHSCKLNFSIHSNPVVKSQRQSVWGGAYYYTQQRI